MPGGIPPAPPASAAAHHQRGRELLSQEKFDEAIVELTAALEADSKMAQAWNARGFAQLRMKRYGAAIADFQRAIEVNPDYENAKRNLEAARKAQGSAGR